MPMNVSAPTLARALVAALAASGVLLQLAVSLGVAKANGVSAPEGLIAYFSYFTVLSNYLVLLVTAVPLLAGGTRIGRWLDGAGVRGCATTAIVLVGLAYHLLLRELWDPQGAAKVADVIMHYAVPAAMLLYWLAFPPTGRLPARSPWLWCAYPVAYFIYALLLGRWRERYPYPFIDVGSLGYGGVLVNALGLLAVFLALGYGVRGLAQRRLRTPQRARVGSG